MHDYVCIIGWQCNMILRLEATCTLYRRRLQPLKQNVQHFVNMKFRNFLYGSFTPSWIRIRPTKINAGPCGSVSEILPATKKTEYSSKQLTETLFYPIKWKSQNIKILWLKGAQAVLRIRIRDPVPFWPLDPGSGIGFFRIPDPKPILLRA